MAKPKFTHDEQYLLSAIRSGAIGGRFNPFMWAYVTGGLLVAGFAALRENMGILLTAFLVVCGFRLYEEFYNLRFIPQWRSIFEKYDEAVKEIESRDVSC